MTRRSWGGTGISMLVHAALLLGLIYAAAQPPQVDATPAVPSRRPKYIYTVTPSLSDGGPGGSRPTAAAPRPARLPESRPFTLAAPSSISRVEPPPVAAVPMITTQDTGLVLGSPASVDGTSVGGGPGSGAGGGRGPGIGPGGGPGVGDVYEAGVGGVGDPKLIHEVKPNFTVDALRGKIQGVVVMEVVVRADGTVDPASIRITRSLDRGLDQQAVIAVQQWRFRPSLRLGQPVASRVTIEIAFTLR